MSDDVTIVASNQTNDYTNNPQTTVPIAVAAAITIATNQGITDTGATSIFIMDGVDVDNKRFSKKTSHH